jgi:iron(II)-dependent oxidoreductase
MLFWIEAWAAPAPAGSVVVAGSVDASGVDIAPEPAALDVVLLPAVEFQMGSTREPDEQPVHRVSVSAFRVDRREVRLDEFRRVMGEAGAARAANHPAVQVSYADAVTYCESQGGRLPTEQEWERACHTDARIYPWGDEQDRPAAWWNESVYGKYGFLPGIMTQESSDPSTYSAEGVEDLAGSVWEWTSSSYHRDSYAGADVSESPWKVIRGGSYANLPSYATCTHREPARPEAVRMTLGFRCVYPVEAPEAEGDLESGAGEEGSP